jgi:hypothetical protein
MNKETTSPAVRNRALRLSKETVKYMAVRSSVRAGYLSTKPEPVKSDTLPCTPWQSHACASKG